MVGDPNADLTTIEAEQTAPVFYDQETGQPIPQNRLELYRRKPVINGEGKTIYYGESPNLSTDFLTFITELLTSLVGGMNSDHRLAENGHMIADWEERYGPDTHVVAAPKPSALDSADATGPFRTAAAEPEPQSTPAPNPAPKAGA